MSIIVKTIVLFQHSKRQKAGLTALLGQLVERETLNRGKRSEVISRLRFRPPQRLFLSIRVYSLSFLSLNHPFCS